MWQLLYNPQHRSLYILVQEGNTDPSQQIRLRSRASAKKVQALLNNIPQYELVVRQAAKLLHALDESSNAYTFTVAAERQKLAKMVADITG